MLDKNIFSCIITLKNKIKCSYSNGVNDKYDETFKKIYVKEMFQSRIMKMLIRNKGKESKL